MKGRPLKSPTPALKAFQKIHTEAESLIAIQEEFAGTGRGKKHEFWKPLNQSAIMFLMAAWEAYIEDVCIWSLEYILKKRPKSNKLLGRAVHTLCDNLLGDSNKICSSGKKRLIDIFINDSTEEIKQILMQNIDLFHNPNSKNVAELIHKCSGMRNITQQWKWKRQKPDTVLRKLNDYMKIRHQIAHGRKTVKIMSKVNRTYARKCSDFVDKLIRISDEAIVDFLKEHIKP